MADEKVQGQQNNQKAQQDQRAGQQNQGQQNQGQGDNRIPGGPHPNQGDQNAANRSGDAFRAQQDQVRRGQAENVERARAERAERPQGVGGNPTPTQQENDEIRSGLRHIDDKEDDGSGPDHGARLDEARRNMRGPGQGQQNQDYKTR